MGFVVVALLVMAVFFIGGIWLLSKIARRFVRSAVRDVRKDDKSKEE